ncbi:phytanoyl-CoA dioxygenase family protein [Cellvibrio mixtus]|uniref:phytanoyl-CoA dioxygenase family protein n=1 Tax=Cellvibrio mixtus TaxID=39650 RepID=UPI0005867D64|nr:phytanoyl-CoA dioxygenase family protein [Cellvibrio mixtus]
MPHPVVALVSRLLDCANAGQAKPLVDQLVADLCTITGIDLHPEFFLDENASITARGKAVSPTTAAQCAEDVERTRVFMQGVYRALQQKCAQENVSPVRVLYAGTGPFALLLVPLLPLFNRDALRVTLLDIHAESLASLRRLLVVLQLDSSEIIEDIVCADACHWQAPQQYDVIISETMRQGLLQEPQVSIFAHLQQFLRVDGWLIPQRIRLDLWLTHAEEPQKKLQHLGNIFQLDKTSATQIGNGDSAILHGVLAVPQTPGRWQDLKLTTEICVFEDCVLRESQSQLTLPLYEKNAWIKPGSILRYGYEQGEYPRFVFAYEREADIDTLLLPDSLEKSALGVYHLRRFWHKAQLQKKLPSAVANERLAQLANNEWQLDRILLDKLGVGLEPAIAQVYHARNISEFERWIEFNHGGTLEPLIVECANRALLDCLENKKSLLDEHIEQPLSDAQLSHWDEHGYVIIPGVLSPQETAAARAAIWDYLQMREDDPESWYKPAGEMKKIMVQLFANPAFEVARQSPFIRAAFQQLWQRDDLVVTTDRVGFNPPETPQWQFPGPSIHWDVELQAPIPFGTQALIYLTDVAAHQGAFSCVPGFHKKIDHWLMAQPKGIDVQQQDWTQWPVKPIAASAGDLIIWHHALPHGSSPNRATFPRMVQYINMYAP